MEDKKTKITVLFCKGGLKFSAKIKLLWLQYVYIDIWKLDRLDFEGSMLCQEGACTTESLFSVFLFTSCTNFSKILKMIMCAWVVIISKKNYICIYKCNLETNLTGLTVERTKIETDYIVLHRKCTSCCSKTE